MDVDIGSLNYAMTNGPFSKFSLAASTTIIISVYGICAKLMAAFLRLMKGEVEQNIYEYIYTRPVLSKRRYNTTHALDTAAA